MEESLLSRIYSHPLPGVAAIGFMRVQRAIEPMPTETHETQYELLFMYSGEKNLNIAGEEYWLHGGDLVCIHPGEPHGNQTCVQNRSNFCYIILSDPETDSRFLRLPPKQRAALAQRLAQMRVTHAAPDVRRLAERLDACLCESDALQPARLSALMLLLLDAATRDGTALVATPPEIERAVRYVAHHPEQLLSVGDLAEIAGLSEARFKQNFKRHMGMPPAEYVLRTRVRLAKDMLGSGEGVARVAMRLGFSSAQHLSQVFKRYTGQSPSAYRAALSNKNENQ